jgi:hypothetical protein
MPSCRSEAAQPLVTRSVRKLPRSGFIKKNLMVTNTCETLGRSERSHAARAAVKPSPEPRAWALLWTDYPLTLKREGEREKLAASD